MEITQLLARYAVTITKGDIEGLMGVFTPDGTYSAFDVAPTVLADARDDMRVAREEIFGPVACVMPFDTFEEVTARSNDTALGLSGGLWTQDVGKAHRLASERRTGTVWVNSFPLIDPAVPFGGHKMSGWGLEMGQQSLDGYLNVKSVWINTD